MEKWRKHLEKVNEELSMFGIVLDVQYSEEDNGYYIWRTDIPWCEYVEDNINDEELCEEISVFGINQIEGEIDKPEDVCRFFKWLYERKQLSFHPDDSFFDYINFDTKERLFTDNEADALNDVMEQCFEVCGYAGADIYKLGINVFDKLNKS